MISTYTQDRAESVLNRVSSPGRHCRNKRLAPGDLVSYACHPDAIGVLIGYVDEVVVLWSTPPRTMTSGSSHVHGVYDLVGDT